jgi:beta-glucosidase
MKKLFPFLFAIIFTSPLSSQVYKDPNAPVEDRVNSILPLMTLNEKLDYIGGVDGFYIRNISRLGLPKIKMSDGPVGVRNYGNTTAYPAGICLASTWDTALIRREGIALGNDARARGVHILLGPGLNIYRAPMCGRNFEYFGEDPYLAGQAAVAYIDGVQSRKVVCTAKHYAGNNQEWDRNYVSSNIDERTLQEIYLPAFRAAVVDGKVGCIMNSYNLVNGVYATQNKHLNNDILKNSWYFDGILMSDWGATHNALGAVTGGLDLEMPNGQFMSRSTLTTLLNNGSITEDVIDDKVRRILRIIFRFGFYDNNQTDNSIPMDNPESDSVALAVAREGIVLLLNNDNILPINPGNVDTIAVIGPNADKYAAGGGSSYTGPFETVSIYEGIQTIAGDSIYLRYASGNSDASYLAGKSVFYTGTGSETKGLTADYFSNMTLTNPVTATRTDTIIDFHWSNEPSVSGLPSDNFSARWTGIIRPDTSGEYEFVVSGDDGFRLWIGDELIINQWTDQAITTKRASKELTKGEEYNIKLEWYENGGLAEIVFGYQFKSGIFNLAQDAAKNADIAIVCVGFDSNSEGEGFDRPFELPEEQDSLINAVASVNPNTVVILNAGGNVDMQNWIGNIKGLLHAWYPGQAGGTAIAEILFGKVNPSGKLPVSFEKSWNDNPVHNSYYSSNKALNYSEGIFMGYRYYTSKGAEPMFPFGYGKSYTSFSYSNLSITEDMSGEEFRFIVKADITNTGGVAGAEVVQLYLKDMECSVERPVRELKSFGRVLLQPEETKTVTMILSPESFSFFSESEEVFVIEKGEFQVIVASSSAGNELTGTINISQDYVFNGIHPKSASLPAFSIYPNPVRQVLNIGIGQPGMETLAEIYDINGRKVDSFRFYGHRVSYPVSQLSNGIYLCRLINASGSRVQKFLLENE